MLKGISRTVLSKVKTGLVPERRKLYQEFKPENKRIHPSVREIVYHVSQTNEMKQ